MVYSIAGSWSQWVNAFFKNPLYFFFWFSTRDKAALKKLFETLGPRYADRPGGYIRLYHLGHRPVDTADMAMVELVDAAPVEEAGKGDTSSKAAQDKETTDSEKTSETQS